jgi:hypothetical protein
MKDGKMYFSKIADQTLGDVICGVSIHSEIRLVSLEELSSSEVRRLMLLPVTVAPVIVSTDK